MALEILYETFRNLDDPYDYPRLYKVYKDGSITVDKTPAEFSQAGASNVTNYLAEFKSYLSDLVSSIPEEAVASADTEKKIKTILTAGSYLRSAMPLPMPIDPEAP